MNEKAKLCYVKLPIVWFTTDFANQWGDDWNDAPYEHNAGDPYPPRGGRSYELFQVAIFVNPFTTCIRTPADENYPNSPWSVKDINNGAVPWLRFMDTELSPPKTFLSIMAGTSYAKFRALLIKYGIFFLFPPVANMVYGSTICSSS